MAAVILQARPAKMLVAQEKPALDLRVADRDGRMRIDWDTSNPLIASSHGATLEVEDGGAFNRYPVEPNILKSGGLDYVRRSDDVLLTLTLYQDGRPGVQSSVRRISPVELPLVVSKPKPQRRQSRARRR